MNSTDFLLWLMARLSLVAGLCLTLYAFAMAFLHIRLWWRRRQMRPFLKGDRIAIHTRERRQMLVRDGEL